MAKADFTITFHGGEDTPTAKTYRPGEQLRGRVMLFTDEKVKCKHFYIRLGWRTEGRGSIYAERVAELDVFQGELSPSIPATHDFAFTLPPQPWSYEGHYISIMWGVQVEIDVPWGIDLKYYEPFILSPQREAVGS